MGFSSHPSPATLPWNYESVLEIYRRLKTGRAHQTHGGAETGGLVFVQSAPDPNPIAPAMLEGARSIGIPTFDSNNGRLMEGDGGASILDLRVRDGKRLSVFRTYAFPYMDRPNLTVLTQALVKKVTLKGKRATGVEIAFNGKIERITAGLEVCSVVRGDSHAKGVDAFRHWRSG